MLAPALVANVRHLFQTEKKKYMKMIPKLCHYLLLFFFREKEIAEMLVRIVSTAPTKRNSHGREINSGPDLPNNNVMIITPATVTQPIDVSI